MRARFTVALAVLLSLIAVETGLAVWHTAQTKSVNDHYHLALALDGAVKKLDGAIGQEEAAVYAPSATDPSLRQAFEKGELELDSSLRALAPYQHSSAYQLPLQLLFGTVAEWRTWAAGSAQALRDGSPPPPQGQGARLLENYRDASLRVESLVAGNARADELQAESETRVTNALLLLGALTLGGTLAGMAVVFFRSTLAPVLALAERSRALAQGRVVGDPGPVRRTDEIGALETALSDWQANMAEQLAIGQTLGAMASTADAYTLAMTGADLMRTILEAAIVSVTIAGPDGPTVLHRSAPGLDRSLLSDRLSSGRWPGSEAIETGTQVISDVRLPVWDEETRAAAAALDLGPVLSQPLRVGGVVTGAVTLLRRSSAASFSKAEVARSEPLLAAMAGALRSAQVIEELRAAMLRLEAADQQKNDFMASMSHELRTPLNSVLGFAQLLKLGTAGSLNAKQERYVDNVEGSGRHLLALINDILDLSKVEAGRMEVEEVPVDLGEAVIEVGERMQEFARVRGVVLEVQGEGRAVAAADPLRVHQVILNLVSNALKFTPAGGLVTVRTHVEGAVASVIVEDTGEGIPGDKLDTIFERFSQLDPGRTKKENGTGLGLPLTRQLMELMGGRVQVRSHPGVGSVFEARFRLHSRVQAPAELRL